MARIGNDRNPGNCVSLLRVNVSGKFVVVVDVVVVLRQFHLNIIKN